uniref:30S ribosomal protein S2 n=1 Tax=Lotharella vacuolata TaxID=74820 RepID=A0A140JZW4_9EUKA|nr:30S ribosomal protein S2 [Lotharella vacuolata]BAU62641.1 30S ribosomal protein S2 [Lotharella vacuolata]
MTTQNLIEFIKNNKIFLKKNIAYTNKKKKQTYLFRMLQANVHLGHKNKKWNPKMSDFIFQTIEGLHIIDIVQSYIYLYKACQLLYKEASNKEYKGFLFAGTEEKSAIPICIKNNAYNCGSFYINKKWLSGTLTNWKNTTNSLTILKYLKLYKKTKNFDETPVKIQTLIQKKISKLERYFGGIQNMKALPEIVIIVGEQTQLNALKECHILKLKSITLLDTNSNPKLVDLFIPANDDSNSSLNFILGEFQLAINLGRQKYLKNKNPLENSNSILRSI